MVPNASNYAFLFPVAALLLFGLAMLSTASAVLSYSDFEDNYYYLKHQLVNGVIPGILLFIAASYFPYRRLKRFALPFFLFAIFLLLLVFAPVIGVSHNGASRWLAFGPFSFQPSEVLKLAFIIYLAALFDSKKQRITSLTEGLIPFLGLSALAGSFLVLEPDLGTLGIILGTALVMYFAAGAKMTHMLGAIALGLVAFAAFIFIFGHAWDRIETFLYPEQDALGSSYQINRALGAIQSGGAFGMGFGGAQQKLGATLPEPMGDSIVAVIALELGLAGIAVILGLFLLLGWHGLSIARHAPDTFGALIATGVVAWILTQAFVNMAAISGMMPLTGIPLPFVSYGGTSLAVLLTACGIVYNIQKTT